VVSFVLRSFFFVLHVHGPELLLQKVGGEQHHLRVALKRLTRRQVPAVTHIHAGRQAGSSTGCNIKHERQQHQAAAAAAAAAAPQQQLTTCMSLKGENGREREKNSATKLHLYGQPESSFETTVPTTNMSCNNNGLQQRKSHKTKDENKMLETSGDEVRE